MVYLDSSAVVPILISEQSSDTCRQIWDDADRRVSSRLTYVEVTAALAMAERQRRISTTEHDEALLNLDEIWPDLDVVDVSSEIAANAARLARSLSLRGYDAVHCASAAALGDPSLVAAAGDAQLLAAWAQLGIAVANTNPTRS